MLNRQSQYTRSLDLGCWRQIQTHIRLAERKLGYLLNFGEALMKDGITRAVNGLQE